MRKLQTLLLARVLSFGLGCASFSPSGDFGAGIGPLAVEGRLALKSESFVQVSGNLCNFLTKIPKVGEFIYDKLCAVADLEI